MDQIIIRGARQHNLKNIDLVLPRNKFVVITGVSGSGKSSLAFDTLFSEGQRRYVEALSAYARQLLQRLSAPAVDEIVGLSPSIAIEQKGLPHNPRSTVGTLTEVNDYLRLLFARLATALCPSCGIEIRAYTIPRMVHEISTTWPSGARLLIVAPLGRTGEKELSGTLLKLRRDGFARIRMDGTVYDLDPLPLLPRRLEYTFEVIVDRIVLGEAKLRRLGDSLELAAGIGRGVAGVVNTGGGEKYFSENYRCLACGYEMPEPVPSLFSFHHPLGACPECGGSGLVRSEAPQRIGKSSPRNRKSEKPDETGNRSIHGGSCRETAASGEGVCPSCGGSRLNRSARAFRLGGMGIDEVVRLPIPAVKDWLFSLDLSDTELQIAARPRQEIVNRIDCMSELGLSYLTLERPAHTLSGGEVQRTRLAHQISTALSGVLYVLDEPSIGLHPRDHQKLLDMLFRLRDAGNSVVVVEHDRQTILQADYLVDMGPGAGVNGGRVVFAGTPLEILSHPESLTGQYLSGRKEIAIPPRRIPFSKGALRVVGAKGHNLKDISVSFPLGCLTCVTGVSGSGKSTLVLHTLHKALANMLYGSAFQPCPFEKLENAKAVHRVSLIDQSPLGRTPRSTPATYTGLFDQIRQIFSYLPESRARGYRPSRFSFNVKGGRCETCGGEGLQRIEMFFLPDVYITCPICNGSRYGADTLDILFKGHSIASVLDMTVSEAIALLENFPPLRRKMETLIEVGLGYIRLGQSATTLSGGEAQRVKLAAELSRQGSAKSLYILDEPTTGLHFDDIEKLLHVLQRLVDLGHTVILIEHHPDVVKTADFIIDLGPGGGNGGGYVIATGSPEEIARTASSHTGKYLREILGKK